MFKNINCKANVAVTAIILVLSLYSLVWADSLMVDIDRGAVIVNDDRTDARLLMGFDLPEELTQAEIIFAELKFPIVSVIRDSSALGVNCYPLLISWDPDDINWADLGDTLDTDVIGEVGTEFAVAEEGSHESYFDITDIVRSWLDGTVVNNGLIFFCDSDRIPRFRYNRNRGEPFAQVRIVYGP